MSEKQVTLITLIVLAVILIAGGVGFWYLHFNVLAGLKEENEKLQAAVKADEAKRNEILSLEKKRNEAAEKAALEVAKIPDLDIWEYDRFVNTVEEMRRQAGITISQATYVVQRRTVAVRPGEKPIPTDVHRVDYEFTCQGRFYPLLRFINLVETNKRFIDVQTCNVSLPQLATRGASSLSRGMKIKIATYTFKVPPVAAKPGDRKETAATPSTPLPQ